jgi:hypothetical protein
MWSRGFDWRMRPRPAIRFGCRWWMRGGCGWNRFRLFAGSARVEGKRHLVGGGRAPMGGMSDPSRGWNAT